MDHIADHRESNRARRPFERVSRTVERLKALPVLGILAQTMKEQLHSLQIFLRFWHEVRQHLGIESRHEIVQSEHYRFRLDRVRQRGEQSCHFDFPSFTHRQIFSTPLRNDLQLRLERSHHPA